MLDVILAVGPWAILLIGLGAASIYGWGYYRGAKDLPKIQQEIKDSQKELDAKAKETDAKIQKLRSLENASSDRERRIEEKTYYLEQAQQRNFEKQIQRRVNDLSEPILQREQDLDHREQTLQKKIDFFEKSKAEALAAIPWLAKAFADLDAQKALFTAHRLETKQNPAFAAADKVREAGKARREAIYLAENYKLQLDYYLSLFPWLEDYLLLTPDEVASMSASAAADDTTKYDGYEAVKEWLSPDEYDTLSNTQKWQLALDRYNNRSKTNWQLGIEYERYVGYTYEQQGYRVRYTGATQGMEDMGRDLIAENRSECLIIQCKRWAKEKTIHEKHIFQLYGTCVLQQLHSGQAKPVHGVFVTTTVLSQLARECADYLHITVRERVPLGAYPQIKCNIAKTGERIYHLPFDQQYDRTMLNPADGDCYAATVAEAEAMGFRRAFRWHGSS